MTINIPVEISYESYPYNRNMAQALYRSTTPQVALKFRNSGLKERGGLLVIDHVLRRVEEYIAFGEERGAYTA